VKAFFLFNLPEAVKTIRFFAPLFVFILGIINPIKQFLNIKNPSQILDLAQKG